MCGFAGIARVDGRGVSLETLASMGAAVRHRGPDGYGFYADRGVGLAHVRLSIIDPEGGVQPWTSACGRFVMAYNGVVYNYVELRSQLETAGRSFRTRGDTEVVLESFAEWGADCLRRFNGQFAFALHDRERDALFLARDRFGIRPLFYAHSGSTVVFGSEVKALYASGLLDRTFDPHGLDQVFTFWGARAPVTPFRGVRSLRPGEWLEWRDGRVRTRSWHTVDYDAAEDEGDDAIERLDAELRSSVRFRLRSDVTVGGYLSGGLDSSITCALSTPSVDDLHTFSITFDDPEYDESEYQSLVSRELGTDHCVTRVTSTEIGRIFPEVIRHTETPLVRTAPAPLFLLSRAASEHGIKVVLTGEGADEIFWGYDIFKEVAVRRFCLRQPESEWRPRLFDRLYPYLSGTARTGSFWRRFFLDAGEPSDSLFSHLPRFRVTSRIKDLLSREMQGALEGRDALEDLRDDLPDRFGGWSALQKAAWLEIETLMSPYLLASQGDRMAMAHGVEGRFPFLDHHLVDFASELPDRSKLRTLSEKDILRRWARDTVPERVRMRVKQPYRAPDVASFFGSAKPDYLDEILSPSSIRKVGVFDASAVAGLTRRCEAGLATGFRESQAAVAVISTQLLAREMLVAHRPTPLPIGGADVVMGGEAR